jgi:putative oxidoreductase
MKKIFHTSDKSVQWAITLLRVGFGIIYILHGFPKILGGPDTWESIGGTMGIVGLGFAPAFWGFMASISEFGGGLLLVFGFLTRPAAAFMAFTMLMATIMHITVGDPLNTVLHPLKGLVVFITLIYGGPGNFAIDNRWDLRTRQ